MIDLSDHRLTFSFPEIHDDARLVLEFQRTLRMPHDAKKMPRLASRGRYRLYPVADYAERVPQHWLDHGGAMLPMYQSEAMWIGFRPAYSVAHGAFFPFAVQVGVGGLNALSGHRLGPGLDRWPQDFLEIVDASWLGGFRAGARGIRQFVAMPLGSDHVPIAGASTPGGFGELELVVFPMRRRSFDLRFPSHTRRERVGLTATVGDTLAGDREQGARGDMLGRQRIEEGLFPLADWQIDAGRRYRLRLVNSLHWCAITGGPPATTPPGLRGSRWSDAAFMAPSRLAPVQLQTSPPDSD
jgi:hypothetical protein